MKKLFLFFVVALLVGCVDYTDDFNTIDDRLDALELIALPSIEKQVEDINTQLTSLKATDDAIKVQITELENTGKANTTEIADLKAKDQALEKSINDLQSYVDTQIANAKSEAAAAYATVEQYNTIVAQLVALQSSTSKLGEELTAKINAEVKSLTDKITDLEARLKAVEDKVKNLLARIQSVSYIPVYSDGKATLEYSNTESKVILDFEISPKDAVAELAKVWDSAISAKAVYTQTRAVSFVDMPIISFEADVTNGVISVTASGENLSEAFFAGTQEASIALAISDGNNSVTSEYVQMIAISNDECEYVFEVTGEPIVHNAVSVDIPVKAQSLNKIAVWVREYAIDANGDERIVVSRDYKGEIIFGDLITKLPRPQQIMNKGKLFECYTSLSTLHLSGNEGLDRNMKFVYYIVATMSAQGYWPGNNLTDYEIYTGTFTTPDKYADDDVAVIRESGEGMDVYVTFPPSVKKVGRRVKWGVTNLPTLYFQGNKPIAKMLISDDTVYPAAIIKNDTLLEINNHNAYRRNANGEIGYYKISTDQATGKSICIEVVPNSSEIATGEARTIQYYHNLTPGEPLILMFAEVDYSDIGNTGWNWFPYDMEAYNETVGIGGSTSTVDSDQFWHEGAWYRKVELRLPGPKVFEDGSVKVEVSNMSPDGATLKLTPTGKTFCYFFAIYEDKSDYGDDYNDIVKNYFKGDEGLWQWFTTSEMGSQFGIRGYLASEGPQEIQLEKYFATIKANSKYHIVVNAMDGEAEDDDNVFPDYSAQKFQHITFSLPNYTFPLSDL